MQDKRRFDVNAEPRELWAAAGYLLLFSVLLRALPALGAAAAAGGVPAARYLLPPFAYLVPLFVAFLRARGARGVAFATAKGCAFADALPLLPLFLGAVTACAYLTEVVLDALGIAAVGGGVAGMGFLPDLVLNCLLPAVLEEVFFRGLILSLLWKRMGGGAIFLSALVFALAHGSVYQIPYAFVGGLFLSLAAVVSGSVAVPFLFHFLNNFLSLALQYTPRAWMEGGVVIYLVYGALALGMVASVVFLSKKKDAPAAEGLSALFSLPRGEGARVLRAAFASPLAIYMVPMLIFSLWRAFV